MKKTVVALYDELSDARAAVEDLVDAGFAHDQISLVASDPKRRYATYFEDGQAEAGQSPPGDEKGGAVTGGVVGGLAGLLVGLGTFAIPGIGPVIAAGPIAAGLIGAGAGTVSGGLIGAIIEWDIPEEEARYYAEGVRRGGTLVAVKSPNEPSNQNAINLINRHRPVNIEQRASQWRKEGWTDPESEKETTS